MWKYLGVHVDSLAGEEPGDRNYGRHMEQLAINCTWERQIKKIEGRTGIILASPGSAGHRCMAW
ncbi:MAG: hypothetical protein ACKPKO_21550, partial [Candidatus Fonsibacter sp.]